MLLNRDILFFQIAFRLRFSVWRSFIAESICKQRFYDFFPEYLEGDNAADAFFCDHITQRVRFFLNQSFGPKLF